MPSVNPRLRNADGSRIPAMPNGAVSPPVFSVRSAVDMHHALGVIRPGEVAVDAAKLSHCTPLSAVRSCICHTPCGTTVVAGVVEAPGVVPVATLCAEHSCRNDPAVAVRAIRWLCLIARLLRLELQVSSRGDRKPTLELARSANGRIEQHGVNGDGVFQVKAARSAPKMRATPLTTDVKPFGK